jgi:hypothetical protein
MRLASPWKLKAIRSVNSLMSFPSMLKRSSSGTSGCVTSRIRLAGFGAGLITGQEMSLTRSSSTTPVKGSRYIRAGFYADCSGMPVFMKTQAGARRTNQLRHSRRSGTWPAMMMFEFP